MCEKQRKEMKRGVDPSEDCRQEARRSQRSSVFPGGDAEVWALKEEWQSSMRQELYSVSLWTE